MMIIINALKSISRSKGRNILIGIIVLTIAISSCIALAIKNAASEAEASGLDGTKITASISVDRQKIMDAARPEATEELSGESSDNKAAMENIRTLMQQYSDLDLAQLQDYANSKFVNDFYYTDSVSLNTSGALEPFSSAAASEDTASDENAITEGPGTMEGRSGGFGFNAIGAQQIGDMTVTGYSSEKAMTKFVSGASKITDGELFDFDSADLNCLISSDLATFNGLSVGDFITLSNPNSEDEVYTFKITGIYTDETSGDAGMGMRFSTASDPANLICVSGKALAAIEANSATAETSQTDSSGNETTTAMSGQIAGVYELSNTENYEAFEAELRAGDLADYYSLVSQDISNYEASLIPLQNLSDFATTLLLIILIVGGIILVVINIFNIRERKYEIGVLAAIGIKKQKVALQLVIELLIVTFIAIAVGSGIGAVASVPVSNNLLSAQVESQQSQAQNQADNFGRPLAPEDGATGGGPTIIGGGSGESRSLFGRDGAAVEYISQIDATANLGILLKLIGIGLLLTIVASLAAVIFALRFEPLQILANRS